jgi:transposase
MCQIGVCTQPIDKEGEVMKTITRIGLDLAKNIFQVHAVDKHEHVVLRKTLKRHQVLRFFAQCPACLIGIEACSGAHYWARELEKLGHRVKIMAPQFVVPYRKNGKNDANDAEAICEAVARPTMRFVPMKSVEQQAVLTLHRARQLLVQERTALVNHMRGLLLEYGIAIPLGVAQVRKQLPALLEDAENGLPDLAREVFAECYHRLRDLDKHILSYERQIKHLAKHSERAQRLMQLEGVGPITATAIVASVGNARVFKNGRQFAAWLGLTPRQYSSGGKVRLGAISKRGDVYLRTLLIHGMRSALLRTPAREDKKSRWVEALRQRRNSNVATVALAAKQARIIWAMLANEKEYQLAL